MDEQTRATINEIEAHSRFPTGIGRIERGECPRGFLSPTACMLCPNGHMLECHFPYTCEEVECSHYQREMEAEMTQLEGCIQFWEAKLLHDRYLMNPSTQTIIESTIKYLKELQRLKGSPCQEKGE